MVPGTPLITGMQKIQSTAGSLEDSEEEVGEERGLGEGEKGQSSMVAEGVITPAGQG